MPRVNVGDLLVARLRKNAPNLKHLSVCSAGGMGWAASMQERDSKGYRVEHDDDLIGAILLVLDGVDQPVESFDEEEINGEDLI